MAPFLFALALMIQDAPAPEAAAPEGPVATAVPRKQAVAPLPIQGGAITAPTDDYGYVGWCFGAIASYVELYDRAMPEVIRIERAWPTPSTEENINEVYPGQREEAKRNLALFTRAMAAAERASPTLIRPQGMEAVRRGRAMWTGATSVPKAQLAQFWMSWSPPAKCEVTAKALESRSMLLGQALTYANRDALVAAAPPPPPEDPSAPTLALASPSPSPSLRALATEATSPPVAAETPVEVSAGDDSAMVYAQPLPSADPDVAVTTDDTAIQPDEPASGAVEIAAGDAPSAIDDLLPVAEPEPTPVVVQAPVAAPAPPSPPIITLPRTEPAKPPVRKKKRGLKETLQGMRGRQE